MSITIYGPGVADKIPAKVAGVGRAVEQVAQTDASSDVSDATDNNEHDALSTFEQLKQRSGSKPKNPQKQVSEAYEQQKEIVTNHHQVIHVEEIMTTPIVTLSGRQPLKILDKVFNDTGYRHIPLVGIDSKVVGIITDRDLLDVKFTHPETWSIQDCEDALQRPLMEINEKTDIRLLAQRFLSEHQDAAIVMDFENNPRGIVTLTDILKAIVNRPELEFWG